MKIDAEKLARLIADFADQATGACTTVSACIGMVDGKEIHLRIEADEEEMAGSVNPKWQCVTETERSES